MPDTRWKREIMGPRSTKIRTKNEGFKMRKGDVGFEREWKKGGGDYSAKAKKEEGKRSECVN